MPPGKSMHKIKKRTFIVDHFSETYLRPTQASMMERSEEIVNGILQKIVSGKNPICFDRVLNLLQYEEV